MKENIKKITMFFFGTEENLLFKLNLSCFIMGSLSFILGFIADERGVTDVQQIFTFSSGCFLAVWLVLVGGTDTLEKFGAEIIRIWVFLITFLFSLNYCVSAISKDNTYSLLRVILSCLGLFLCTFYFISKFIDIIKCFKRLFRNIFKTLFDSIPAGASRLQALIENITAFLVSIAALAVSIKTVVDALISPFLN